ISTAVVTKCSKSTHQRSPAYGRTCSDHPSGDNHDSALELASPTARSVNAIPSTVNAAPRANRALGDNCAATAATVVNTRPEHARAAQNASEPLAGTSSRNRLAKPMSPVRIEAPDAKSSVAVRLAYRPTAVESISSVRPVSSSARV